MRDEIKRNLNRYCERALSSKLIHRTVIYNAKQIANRNKNEKQEF